MDVNERVNTIEKNLAEFRDLFQNMNAAIQKLSIDITSLQVSSAQERIEEIQQSRRLQIEQQPPRTLMREFEAENNLGELDDMGEDDDEEDRYRPRDRRYGRRYK